jgi:(1->4)-alpha-D-glucan 1-alpha-D-glucosylmutase
MFALRIPVATYRLQFNRQFRFEDARDLVPYLRQLGISDLYASPILKARKGSLHGYDVTDPTRLNSELGTKMDFNTLVRELRNLKIGLILDIVPNHMAASPENPWWVDLMENGLCSPYVDFFDIDWNSFGGRILLPLLTYPYEKALENQELVLTLEDAGFFVQYDDYRLPLDVKSYRLILSYCLDTLEKAPGPSHPDYERLNQLTQTAERLPSVTDLATGEATKHYRDRQAFKESFLRVVRASPQIKTALLQTVTLFNGKRGEPRSLELMDNLLLQQVYQLAFWKTAHGHINYRRFFDISDLIGVRVEELQVFEASHSFILTLVDEGKVSGLRIDHIDGLNDPFQYLFRLQQHIGPKAEGASTLPRFYVVIEKILTSDEVLSPEWPVFGTTGYDFANTVNNLFVDSSGAQALGEIYFRFIDSRPSLDNIVYEKKKQVIKQLFPAEMRALGEHFLNLARQDKVTANLSAEELTRTLVEVTACLPVYRTYARAMKVPAQDQRYLEQAVEEARRRNPDMDTVALDFLKRVLTLDFDDPLPRKQKEAQLNFVLRWQQLTGAIMAKGFEDTALYCYNRLVSLNEVGGQPDSLGLSVDGFHRRVLARQERWPYTLNATSTHDTKRGEDIRARINVLSEIPEEWEKHLAQWRRWNEPKKQLVNGLLVPEPNIELLFYQTMIGAWPLPKEEVSGFKQRLMAYMLKAVREAKSFTSWLTPNSDYEGALISFLESALDSTKENGFLEDFLQLWKQVSYYGALNSLAQVLLKIGSPGVPDFYQGTEFWDLSLVDPDNRRPVDFRTRVKALNELTQQEAQGQEVLIQQVLKSWEDGRVKLYVTYKALGVRESHRDLFRDGGYIPLQVTGPRQEHVCAFARRRGEEYALIMIPRLLTKLVRGGVIPVGREVWGEDLLLLPEGMPGHWLNIFTGERLEVPDTKRGLRLADLMCRFPVALLIDI